MIVPTLVFLILLVPLLVQGAPSAPCHDGNGSGNLPNSEWCPVGCTRVGGLIILPKVPEGSYDHRPCQFQPTDTDRSLDATILPQGSTYMLSLELGTIDAQPIDAQPIPADGYHRVPVMAVVVTPKGGFYSLSPSRIVRLSKAYVPASRVDNSHVHTLPINQFLHRVVLSAENDQLLGVTRFPDGSKYNVLAPSTIHGIIPTDRYFQLPSAVVVTTAIGDFHRVSDRVVRTVYVEPHKLRAIKKTCENGFETRLKHVPQHERELRLDRPAYLEHCGLCGVRTYSISPRRGFDAPPIPLRHSSTAVGRLGMTHTA